jgi:signal transduction histidine kinase
MEASATASAAAEEVPILATRAGCGTIVLARGANMLMAGAFGSTRAILSDRAAALFGQNARTMPRRRTLPASRSLGAWAALLTGCAADAAGTGASTLAVVALGALACLASFAAGWLAARLRAERGWRDGTERPAPGALHGNAVPNHGSAQQSAPSPPLANAGDAVWLEALGGPALLAAPAGEGWAVLGHNEAARSLWPAVASGTDVRALSGLPAFWPDKAARDQAPGKADPPRLLDGWRAAPMAGSAPAGSWLVHRADGAPEPDATSFTLSHDLRAPIRVVEGFTRIVKEDYGRALDRVGNDHLDRVLAATARMNLMIDALLTMARLSAQPLARRPVDLSQLAAQVIDDLRRASPERDVAVQIEPGLGAAGDPTLLRLVLENLLGNAWKYTARTEAAAITMSGSRHQSAPAFVVADNGAGFDMRAAERLFGLFQRLHSAADFPGHGVGLASVRRIVRRHGGDVWAHGEPGRGARFTFTLP